MVSPIFFYISSVISSPYKLRCALPRCPGGSCRRTSSRFHGSWPVRNNRAYRLREPWCLSQSRHGRQARCDVHFTACLISSSRSSLASRPMLRRTVVSGTDISAHCSGVKRPKIVEAGWIASDLRSKRFVARRMICSLSMNAQAASFDSRSMVKTAPGNGPNCVFDNS